MRLGEAAGLAKEDIKLDEDILCGLKAPSVEKS